MKSVGETIKARRLERNLSLDEAAAATRIKKEFLIRIENNRFDLFASAVTAKGFVKNYAEYLGLSAADVLAVYRRDSSPVNKKLAGLRIFQPDGNFNFNWTPKLTLIVIMAVFILGILGYLISQYLNLRQNPRLEIIGPADRLQVFEEKIIVAGRSEVDALVKVNDNLVILSDKGEFRYELPLFLGENKIVIEATSKFGRKSLAQRVVFRLDKN